MDRRDFLKRGVIGGALLTLFGGGVLAVRRGDYPDVGARELRVLDPATFWILAAVAARTTPAQGEIAAQIAYDVEAALRCSPPQTQKDFPQALYLLENALPGLFFRGTTTVFTRLAPAEQDQALYAWRDSRIGLLRGAYQGLRRLTLGAYYSNVDRARSVGYPGPIWAVPAPPRVTDQGPLSPPYVVVPPRPVPDAATDPPAPGSPEDAAAPTAAVDGTAEETP